MACVVGTGTAVVPGKGADDGVCCIGTGTGVVTCKGADNVAGVEGDTETGLVHSNTSSSLRPVYHLAAFSMFS